MTDTPPAPPAGSQNDDKTIAIITHLSGIFLGFIVPLVIWLIKKDQSQYLAEEAKEALNFQITIAIAYIIGMVLTMILIGVLVIFAVMIANVVLCIIAAIKVSNTGTYRYPFALRLIK